LLRGGRCDDAARTDIEGNGLESEGGVGAIWGGVFTRGAKKEESDAHHVGDRQGLNGIASISVIMSLGHSSVTFLEEYVTL
jgi:hypothetical protein